MLCGDNSKQTTSTTFWAGQALAFDKSLREGQIIKISGFETPQKGSFDDGTLPFIIKPVGINSKVELLATYQNFGNMNFINNKVNFLICID